MGKFIVIGERIHCISPVIRKAMAERDPEPILKRAKEQLDAGATYLDLNIGPAESDGEELMQWGVKLLQENFDNVPLALDTANMKAIEAGIITESTKERLLELEDQRKELTASIKFEQAMSTDLTPDQVRFWLEDLRNGDFEDMEYQRFLIKTFVQAIYLYDDHFRIVFNYGGNEEKVPLTEIDAAGSDGAEGSTNRCQAPPEKSTRKRAFFNEIRLRRVKYCFAM